MSFVNEVTSLRMGMGTREGHHVIRGLELAISLSPQQLGAGGGGAVSSMAEGLEVDPVRPT